MGVVLEVEHSESVPLCYRELGVATDVSNVVPFDGTAAADAAFVRVGGSVDVSVVLVR